MLVLSLLLSACTHPDDTGDTSASASKGDFEAQAVLDDDMTTVAWVSWTTDSPGTSWVEYGPDRDLGRSTVPSTAETTDHAVLLAGMTPSSTWYWRAVSEVGGERLESRISAIDTGLQPRDLPRVTVPNYDASLAWPGYTLTTSVGDPSWVIVFDSTGAPVWWRQAEDQTVIAQARLSADGTSILYNVASLNFGVDLGAIINVRLDGEVLSETRTVEGHHDFVALPEGGAYAYIAADPRPWTDPTSGTQYTVVGDDIIEVPEGATDGTANRTVWSTWDHLDVSVDPAVDNDFYPDALDWTHCNSLNLNGDTYLLSVRKEDAFVEVDRATGDQKWQLGGVLTDFTQTGDGRTFHGQHSPELIDDGFMLFDNGDPNEAHAYSQAAEYSLDEAGRTYTQTWSYDFGKRISSYLLGDVERLPNGNTLISWGSGGTLTEVTQDGQLALEVDLAIGAATGFTHHLDALGGAPQ